MVGTIIICFGITYHHGRHHGGFARDESMRNTIGFQAYTPEPKSAGDYILMCCSFFLQEELIIWSRSMNGLRKVLAGPDRHPNCGSIHCHNRCFILAIIFSF